jgi:hypothetical protein
MKTIVVINDGSKEAAHAAAIAYGVAQKVTANLILANLVLEKSHAVRKRYALSTDDSEIRLNEKQTPSLAAKLALMRNEVPGDFKPEINELEAADLSINEFVHFINQNNVWMMVKRVSDTEPGRGEPAYLSANIQCVLNRVMSPLLLVSEKCKVSDFERIVYMADLRYCQLPAVKYLTQFARAGNSDLQIAHVAANGLPDMEENYARSVFNDAIASTVKYERLFFNNIRERNLKNVVDVLINGLHSDLLVLVNHQFHFEELMGRYLNETLPGYITVPVLVFPY